MADKKNKHLHDGFSTLVHAIEELTNTQLSLEDAKEIDLDEMHRNEAHRAHMEITQERLKKHKDFVSAVYKSHRVDPRWNFDSVKIDDLNKNAFNIARGFCAATSIQSTATNLLLVVGGPGSGKTVLSNCVANEFLNKFWKDVEIISYSQIKRIRVPSYTDSYYEKTEKNQQWEKLLQVDLLILDGLCQNNEILTDWDKQTLSELLRTRYQDNKTVVITTPVSPNALPNHIGGDCFESIKEFSVMSALLYGNSRRNPINITGMF